MIKVRVSAQLNGVLKPQAISYKIVIKPEVIIFTLQN